MIIEIAIIMLYVCILGLAIACHINVSKAVKEVDHILEVVARMSKVLTEHEQKFESLTVNEPRVTDEEEKKEQKADNDYNEGMNNIFGYSVNTGIKVGDD